jgi:hypothetical protein
VGVGHGMQKLGRHARPGRDGRAPDLEMPRMRGIYAVPGFISHIDHVWDEPRWANFLERLASFSRLICFDNRGTGLSDRVSAQLRLTQACPSQSGNRAFEDSLPYGLGRRVKRPLLV